MSLLFSRHCEYALQAVCYLALRPAGEKTSIKELSKKLGIPYHFLGKILQDLTAKGLLSSQKGPSGGFALQVSPHEMTLFQIVEAVDGLGFLTSCVLGFAECSGRSPCAAHERWAEIRAEIHDLLVRKNILETAKQMKMVAYKSATG